MGSLFSKLFGRKEAASDESGAEEAFVQEQSLMPETVADSSIFPEESFGVFNAEIDGNPVIGSVNKGYNDYDKKDQFPWCLHIGIALELENVGGDGLATYNENSIAYQMEDEFIAAINKIVPAHFIGHLFSDGFLDVYFYLPEPKAVHEYLQSTVARNDLLRGFGYEINNDPEWESVSGLLG